MSSVKAQNVNHPGYTENLKEEKYTLIRTAILAALPPSTDRDGMSFAQLEEQVRQYLERQNTPAELFPKPGSVRWYTKTVQLDLEAKGLIERLPHHSPLHLRQAPPA